MAPVRTKKKVETSTKQAGSHGISKQIKRNAASRKVTKKSRLATPRKRKFKFRFFDFPLELREMIYEQLSGDCDVIKQVSHRFWDEFQRVISRGSTEKVFSVDYAEIEQFKHGSIILTQHYEASHRHVQAPRRRLFDPLFAKNVQHLVLRGTCFNRPWPGPLREMINCCHEVPRLRPAFPGLKTVACCCIMIHVDWSKWDAAVIRDTQQPQLASITDIKWINAQRAGHFSHLELPSLTGYLAQIYAWYQLSHKVKAIHSLQKLLAAFEDPLSVRTKEEYAQKILNMQVSINNIKKHLDQMMGPVKSAIRLQFQQKLQQQILHCMLVMPFFQTTTKNAIKEQYYSTWIDAEHLIDVVLEGFTKPIVGNKGYGRVSRLYKFTNSKTLGGAGAWEYCKQVTKAERTRHEQQGSWNWHLKAI